LFKVVRCRKVTTFFWNTQVLNAIFLKKMRQHLSFPVYLDVKSSSYCPIKPFFVGLSLEKTGYQSIFAVIIWKCEKKNVILHFK